MENATHGWSSTADGSDFGFLEIETENLSTWNELECRANGGPPFLLATRRDKSESGSFCSQIAVLSFSNLSPNTTIFHSSSETVVPA